MRAADLLSPALTRVLITVGFTIVGWLLATAFAGTAQAVEEPDSTPDTVTVGLAPVLTNLTGVVGTTLGSEPAPAEPAQPADTGDNAAAPRSPGLLGGLTQTLGSLVGAVTGTVTGTVEDVTGTIEDIAPIVDDVPSVLPELGTLVPGTTQSAPAPGADTGSAPVTPRPAPVPEVVPEVVPEPQPEPAPAVAVPAATKITVLPSTPLPAPPKPQPAQTGPTDSDAGGGSPGGQAPVKPLPPAPATITGATSGTVVPQDHNATDRSVHGILGWAPSRTQLRLAGASRDHDATGAGRDAALPTTTPD